MAASGGVVRRHGGEQPLETATPLVIEMPHEGAPGRRQRHAIAALVAGNVAPLDELQIPQPAKHRGHRRLLDAEAAAEVARPHRTDDMERHRHDDLVFRVAAIAVAGAMQDRIDVRNEVPHEGADAVVEQGGGGGGFGHNRSFEIVWFDFEHSMPERQRWQVRHLAANLTVALASALPAQQAGWPIGAGLAITPPKSTPCEGQIMRKGAISRKTSETKIDVAVDLDGSGKSDVRTGVGFFDHMLEQLARHSLIDLTVRAEGDRHIDDHHTVEDVGIALGQALRQALGDKAGVTRYADCLLPMDEALTRVAIDVSGRPFLVFRVEFPTQKIGAFDAELVREFFQAFAVNGGLTLHIENVYGANSHHIAETCFKGVARALGAALAIDPRQAARIPSTKGAL